MQIVITGGTGFLGSALVTHLRATGHVVSVLTRKPTRQGEIEWNPGRGSAALVGALRGADAVVNLAGASLAQRWTKAHKRALWESRVSLTQTLVHAMNQVDPAPRVLVSGSAIGIYGDRGDEPLTETSVVGNDFLASLGTAWEQAALAAGPRTRTVLLRTGLALERSGGVLPQMALPFRFFAGGPIGSGRQYLSWIHRDDWVAMTTWALTNPAVSGPLNATAPEPATNREFTKALGRALHRPAFMPAPGFALRVVLGEMANLILEGQRVLPAKAGELGFRFRYPQLEPALRAICSA
ncbi:MAG: TIGR01777 family protein [Acidobacteria bacterium]|nr:TIGR01777 family protein [Acidobacteriota bacterium]